MAFTECYVMLFPGDGNLAKTKELPCYPEDISDSTSSNWAEENIIGRSSPLTAYGSTNARDVNFTMTLHREMESKGKIEEILVTLRQALYPHYMASGLLPPTCLFRFGDFRVRGYMSSISYTWKKPIIDSKYTLCDVSISIKEVPTKILTYNIIGNSTSMNPSGVS